MGCPYCGLYLGLGFYYLFILGVGMSKKISLNLIYRVLEVLIAVIFLMLVLDILIPTSKAQQLKGFQIRTIYPSGVNDIPDVIVAGERGSNVIRYPIMWGVSGAPLSLSKSDFEAGLWHHIDKIKRLYPALDAKGMKLIIVLHHPWGGLQRVAKTGRKENKIFSDAIYRAAFLEHWQILTRMFNNDPHILAFELINEPVAASTQRNYLPLMLETARAVRAIDPSRTIIIMHMTESLKYMRDMRPLDLENIWYGAHMYLPMRVTHYGLQGNYSLVKWRPSKSRIKKYMNPARQFFLKYKKPVIITEWAVTNYDPENQYKYSKDFLEVMEEWGWPWVHNGDADVWKLENRTSELVGRHLSF